MERAKEWAAIASNSGATVFDDGLQLNWWGTPVCISFPFFVVSSGESGQCLDPLSQAIVIYYLYTADSTEPGGEWMAFT